MTSKAELLLILEELVDKHNFTQEQARILIKGCYYNIKYLKEALGLSKEVLTSEGLNECERGANLAAQIEETLGIVNGKKNGKSDDNCR